MAPEVRAGLLFTQAPVNITRQSQKQLEVSTDD